MTEEPIWLEFQPTHAHRLALAWAESARLGWRGTIAQSGSLGVMVLLLVLGLLWIHFEAGPSNGWDRIERANVSLAVLATFPVFLLVLIVWNNLCAPLLAETLPAPLQVTQLDASGITETAPHLFVRRGWAGIRDVRSAKEVTFLMLGQGRAHVLPHDALPDGVTPEELHRRIEAWRAA